jgi:hypothetical protein
VGVDTEFVEKSLSKNTKKPKWGQSNPHNAYVASGILRPLMGRKNRLSLITKDSVLHPSLLLAPDTKGMVTVSDLKKHLKVADLQACTWPMNEFEERVKEFWHDVSDVVAIIQKRKADIPMIDFPRRRSTSFRDPGRCRGLGLIKACFGNTNVKLNAYMKWNEMIMVR